MTRPEIRGLTLRHPWAWAFQKAGKDVENRTWHPSRQGGKPGMFLALHGGAPAKAAAYREEVEDALHWMVRQGAISHSKARAVCPDAAGPQPVLWSTGIIAVAQLVEVRRDSRSPWAAQGQYHWCLKVTPLPEAVPHRGAQGLWTLEADALARVRELYQAVGA